MLFLEQRLQKYAVDAEYMTFTFFIYQHKYINFYLYMRIILPITFYSRYFYHKTRRKTRTSTGKHVHQLEKIVIPTFCRLLSPLAHPIFLELLALLLLQVNK